MADWDLQHDVMARGSFLVSREAARAMKAQGMGGDIVYICSKNSVFAGPNNVAYGAAKADQAHQVRLLAAELGGDGIRVNGINPDGVVRGSGIFAGGWGAKRAAVYGVPEEELGAYYAQRTLLKREVLPEHVANAVFVLCSADLSQHHRTAHPRRRRGRRRIPAMNDQQAGAARGGAVAAVDLGATSGRVVLGRMAPGRLDVEVVHRFPNQPVRTADGLHWNILELYRSVLEGLRKAVAAEPTLLSIGIDSWAIDYGLLRATGHGDRMTSTPFHYRDPRTSRGVGAVHQLVEPSSLRRERPAVPPL